MKERNSIFIKLITSHILLIPVILLVMLLADANQFIALLIPQTILFILFIAGYWEFFGNRKKWMICFLYEACILITLKSRFLPITFGTAGFIWISLLLFFEIYLLFELAKAIWVIFKNEKEKVEIEFPFRDGKYMVTDGGNSAISRLMNYHFHSPVHKQRKTNHSMLHAVDIIKLEDQGKKFLPPENEDYPAYGEPIYCPMAGHVIKVVDDNEDNIPFSGNYPYNTGNTVVIRNGNYYLLLGHMKKGSIVVKTGDYVYKRDKIGECGNSGMSERPHLHMQLMKSKNDNYWKGLGVSMQYKGKNLYKNRLIKI